LDEAETLGGVEPFDGACRHRSLRSSLTGLAARTRAASPTIRGSEGGLSEAPSDDLDEYDCRTNELSLSHYGPSPRKKQQAMAAPQALGRPPGSPGAKPISRCPPHHGYRGSNNRHRGSAAASRR